LRLGTSAVGSGGELWGFTRGGLLVNALEFLADLLDALSAGSRDSGNITVVGVDAYEIGSDTVGLDSGDDDIAGSAVVAAVSAAAEKLANVDNGVVLDGDRSFAVVLDNLVLGILSTATLDEDTSGSLESDGI
jgi:hypothetical protein